MKNLVLIICFLVVAFNYDSGAVGVHDSLGLVGIENGPIENDRMGMVEDVVLSLSSNDQMQYDKKVLNVKAGQKVTLTLTHTGKMMKTVMGHNFVLLKSGTDVAAFALKAMQAATTEYIPESDAIIAHTKLIGGGESDTITFVAPAKGVYHFICSFPGHYAIMKGEFIVE